MTNNVSQSKRQLAAAIAFAAGLGVSGACSEPISKNDLSWLKREYSHNVVQITTPDGRKTLPEYAAAKQLPLALVEKLFKATGKVNCNGHAMTAQITGKNNVLTLASHEFYHRDCTTEKLTCVFTLDDELGSKEYPLDMPSLKTGKCAYSGDSTDWATVKLEGAGPDVLPYEIPSVENPPPLVKGQPVLQVSIKHKNFKVGDKYPKTVEECIVRDVNLHAYVPVQTDCNTGGWSSGSAQFIREESTGKTVIGAINVSESKGEGVPGSGYDPNKLYNSSVELRGEFLKAVMENLKDPISKPVPFQVQ